MLSVAFASFSLPALPAAPAPLEDAARHIFSWLSPLSYVVAGVAFAAALVWCFLGYRLRRARHCYGMALFGAAVALFCALLIAGTLSPMWALVIGAVAAVVFGAVGAIFWRVSAAVSYVLVLFSAVFTGLGLLFPTLGFVWITVIAGLVGVGGMLLLIFVMPDAEIICSSLSGFVAAAAGAGLLAGLVPAWFEKSDRTALVLTVIGVGAVLTAAGMVVQYLTTRKIRPLRRSQTKQLADAKEAIRAAAAITFDEGIEPKEKDEPAAPETPPETPEEPIEAAAEDETAVVPETAELPEMPDAVSEAAPETATETAREIAPDGDVKCPACGGWNEPDSRFCSWCGTKL